MRLLLGWLFLLPLAFAFWLTIMIANGCARRGSGSWRFLGVLSSLVIGGICIQVGYWFTEEGMTILGWIDMIGGGIMALLGTWTSLIGKREGIELREKIEKFDGGKEQAQKWAREEAKRILEQGEIDDYEKFDLVLSITKDMQDLHLFYSLQSLKIKWTEK
ncbi:hypothetical protein ACFLWC_03775 [Chloroflexota bacterium]